MTSQAGCNYPTEPSGGENERRQIERDKLAVEQDKLAVEREKAAVERVKARWSAGAVVVSVLVAGLAYFSAARIQHGQAKAMLDLQWRAAQDAFDLKLVEIVMAGSAHEGRGKMEVLKTLFPTRSAAVANFDPNTLNWGRASKYKLLELIAAQPDARQRQVIVATYEALFDAVEKEEWFSDRVVRAATSSPK